MRKLIAAINMTLDGVFDHTAVDPDAEIHQHYANLLKDADTILYGRITYHLMEYWRTVAANPTGNPATDEFAVTMEVIPKIVFSRTLPQLDWASATLARRDLKEEVLALKQQPGGNILVGSRSLMMQLLPLGLLDEFQLCIHPVIAGGGRPLFENIQDRILFTHTHTKEFAGGAVLHTYRVGTE
ncbi:dihydrofolate reductase family protein [Rufibacter quisquiliarum]|uniref:Dihydrofolate reductase n=1 Tax=Rufibacter quisquiliarum TaxID=1549639 RepID=A0A839H0Y7_9BACT|nr:dihydrofolate reductase family protein [Rufibacter quisquiliarum]MBA9079571.1 dihydrofolate reductase [Rufibacter quisquiliarum]